MDRGEAYRRLANELASYRRLTYGELVQLVGKTYSHQANERGLEYVVDVKVAWFNPATGEISVDGMIGGVNWGSPLSRFDDYFVASPSSQQ